MFKKMTIRLENGKILTIDAAGNSSSNRYVQGLSVLGKKADRYLTHTDLMQGGLIKFAMGPGPAVQVGGSATMPFSLSGK
jgi:putative alpha-1,2-mannosidase